MAFQFGAELFESLFSHLGVGADLGYTKVRFDVKIIPGVHTIEGDTKIMSGIENKKYQLRTYIKFSWGNNINVRLPADTSGIMNL